MKQVVERDGAVDGEVCVVYAIPKFSGIGGSYMFSMLETA